MGLDRKAMRLAARTEGRWDRTREKLMRRIHGDRPARVVGYRSYGTRQVVRVRGRVLVGKPPAPATPEDRWWVNLANTWRRMESDEVPGARVRAELNGVAVDAVADDEGHFTATIPTPSLAADEYWHEAQVELVEPAGAGAAVPVAIPTAPRFGVISDLDDTVLQTDVRNILRMVREVLFGNAHTRIAFPGVGAFYRALHANANPLFYVSSSPWNLYDVLSQFLHLHRIPAGSMELRDWGLSTARQARGGHHGHKREAIDRILNTYATLPFILVGDSGQEDPEIYRSVVHDYPDRILAVYIRSVVPDPDRVDAVTILAGELADQGIDLVLADDTVDAAHHAADRGWIPASAVQDVAVDRAHELAEAEE